MFEKLSSVLFKSSDYSAICKEYSNEDEAYVLYMLENEARVSKKLGARKSA